MTPAPPPPAPPHPAPPHPAPPHPEAWIAALDVADPPEVWAALGFEVRGAGPGPADVCVADVRVADVRVAGGAGPSIRLGAPGEGVTAWEAWVRGPDGTMGQLDTGGELPATTRPVGGPPADRVPAPHHANGVNGLDHLVVATPDLDRTVAALTGAGLDLRRTRDAGPGSGPDGARRMQAFFRLGGTILEVVGIEGAHGGGQATFWGLAFTVDDLDATATFLGDRLGPARDAVQPGRRIATLRRDAGSSVAMAFMSPAGRR